MKTLTSHNASCPTHIVDFTTQGRIWWEELGRSTLQVAGDTMTVSPIAAKKYLYIIIKAYPTGGMIAPVIRFNNDSGTNYANRNSLNGAADVTQVSQAHLFATVDAAADQMFAVASVINDAATPKLAIINIIGVGTSGAGNAPNKRESIGKWHNTSNQITRVDIINISSGDFAIGSEVIVLGHD